MRFVRGVTAARMNDGAFQQTLADAAKFAADDTSPPALAARGLAQYHRDWCAAHETRMQLRAAWAAYFADHDLLLIPGTPVPAFPIDESGARKPASSTSTAAPFRTTRKGSGRASPR